MSLEDTLERPRAAVAPLATSTGGWVTIGTCPQMASMNNYPVAMQLNGITYVISGGDGGNTVLTSPDDGVTWNPPQTGDWPVRRALSGALHAGKFYIVGGFSPGVGFSDTLVSDDCLHFTQVGPAQPPWGVRWAQTLVSTGTNLLMIAGVAGPVYSNQVWSLDDASGAWTKIAEGQFKPRAWAAGAVLGSTLMVIGGWNEPDGAFAESLVSTDGGVTWTTYNAPFTPRHSAAAVTIGDTVYLVGGCTGRPGTTFYSDVWATKDGILWTQVDNTFRPIGRTFAAAGLGGQIGVIGSSADIIGLTPPAPPAPVQGRWSILDSDPNLALQAHRPIIATGNGLLFAYGGDNGAACLRSNDGGASWTPLTADYPPRAYPSGLANDTWLWLIGGEGKSDWLISSNGQHWTPRGDGAGWGPRSGHAVVKLGGQLHLMGGVQGGARQGDVWVLAPTLDAWTLLKADAFSPRTDCAAVVLGTTILLMGGKGDAGPLAEVLSSTDGQTWTTRMSPWTGRSGAVAAVLGDTLYLVGGTDAAGAVLQEVWTTQDGQSWTHIQDLPVALDQPGAAAIGGNLVVLGGTADGAPNPLAWAYNPSTGWIEIAQSQDAGYLFYPELARLGSTTYALNGSAQTTVVASDYERIWASVPGSNLPFRRQAAVCALDGKIWVAGGEMGALTNTVYTSTDGKAWTLEQPEPMWTPRKQHAMAVFEDTLFLIGGCTILEAFNSEVYRKWPDGWAQERVDLFTPRRSAVAVAFNGHLWLLGGEGASGPIAEALRREDDLSWTSFPVPWTARHTFAAGVLGGRLYVALGQGPSGPLTDAWVTADGEHWDPVTTAPGLALQDSAGWLAHDDALLVLGGLTADGQPNFSVQRFIPAPA